MNPFKIQGPAVVSFSGGRTSGYMLWHILDAHGGHLPNDVVVCFANTGREMPATLDFVYNCGAAWNVAIRWLEYVATESGPDVIEVNYNSASRHGEPFEALLRAKSMLPNPVARFCTIELKIRTQKRFIRRYLGWDRWMNIIGLRADEQKRVDRALNREPTKKDRWHNLCPLADAGINESDVFRFWQKQLFDLRLAGRWEGNCDGCFLKNRAALQRMWVDHPDRMVWWSNMEAMPHGVGAGGTFRIDRENYATMGAVMRDQGRLNLDYADLFGPCENGECVI
jgi:3'-phosphoadenosine 5'-phosphosulfate sulfotransferase (PAPS reductase)/FAD synthetase